MAFMDWFVKLQFVSIGTRLDFVAMVPEWKESNLTL